MNFVGKLPLILVLPALGYDGRLPKDESDPNLVFVWVSHDRREEV